ncbi:transposase [Streptomyces sp. NPDC002309]
MRWEKAAADGLAADVSHAYEDSVRCHREKWRLALDMLDTLAGWGMRAPVVVADAAYGTNARLRAGLAQRGIDYVLAVRGDVSAHPFGAEPVAPGRKGAVGCVPQPRPERWVVERAFAHLQGFRSLRIRREIRDDLHEAFLSLGCALICRRRLETVRSQVQTALSVQSLAGTE